MVQKPAIPKGTRDFLPGEVARRTYIFNTIRSVFKTYGFAPIETPSFELSTTLLGKYGEEGDRLIFRILNSGEKMKKADLEALQAGNLPRFANSLAEKALRYDLTVPFARFVVQHQNELSFPFKRYQIQPVWRADRPQHGRYQEFYQCDADVIGSDSLFYEVDFVQIFDQVLTKLGIPGFTIKINNRKILSGIAEVSGESERLVDITIAIDKLDKIGEEGVIRELKEKGVSDQAIAVISPLFAISGSNEERLDQMRAFLNSSETGLKGIEELEYVLNQTKELGLERAEVEFDVTLARGLNYYTGAIFEVKVHDVKMGSVCGGGRYDDLTGLFGLSGVSGVGISFGADRIYDVLNELNLYPADTDAMLTLLFANFGEKEAEYCMKLTKKLRLVGVDCEVYPVTAKMQKQFKYADNRRVKFVAIVGESELEKGTIQLKNMESGEQKELTETELHQLFIK
ncbi:histidine--tRNA ligase [Fluviicola sp.]|jgi:histidyl-tRNA synthetase|uniref:histidine--tRNA ligase n=1 Tax=Fluviicola sp. TaxID=1917219 RepID=UPI002829ACE6|nr:histidine--tRNA ligase [Fluviicola sp.]MDR0802437.1 histidine--tRNA ligase [Fluviicola sp.]